MRLCHYFKKGFLFLAFKGSKFAGLMQYPDRTNKRRGGAKNGFICSYLHPLSIASKTAGFLEVSGGPDQRGKGPAGFSPDTNGGGYWNGGGQRHYKSGGEGVSNQNGKAGVALKKISVQNPQKRFGLANSFGSQKIFRKIFGKTKKGFVSIGRIFGVSGKNLSGVRLFGCIYW